MARVSERELVQLRKQLILVRCDLNRQLLAAELSNVEDSLAWFSTAMKAAKVAAPWLAVAAPMVLRRRSRMFSLKGMISRGLFAWKIGRKVGAFLKQNSPPATPANGHAPDPLPSSRN